MKNILIAGVGGQGTLLASFVLGQVAMELGYDVKLSEVHGMAQRGGSVVTFVRMGGNGEKVYSPIIDAGGADILLAFEQLEGLRWLPYMNKESGNVYVSTQKILPMPVITGAAQYPDDALQQIQAHFPQAVMPDALGMAVQAGSTRAVNTVLLGVLASHMGYERALWESAIAGTVRPAFREINQAAFALGYAYTTGGSGN